MLGFCALDLSGHIRPVAMPPKSEMNWRRCMLPPDKASMAQPSTFEMVSQSSETCR
jgi:hypothetical protein